MIRKRLALCAALIAVIVLTACATEGYRGRTPPPASPTAPASVTPAPATATAPPVTVQPLAALAPPVTLAAPVPSATPLACRASTGVVISIEIPSQIFRYNIAARVYLPPCYRASSARYPVLYLIHGLGFDDNQWERLGMTTAADQLIAAGQIAPLIIVMPQDRRDPRLDPAFVTELVPAIDARFRTVPQSAARAIGGLSRGGGWAVHLGLKYPEVFGRIGLHSPAVFYDDEQLILDLSHHLQNSATPVIYIDTGDDDATIRSPVWLDQVFTWFKLNHTLTIQPGGHSEAYWSQHVTEYLQFYAADWRNANFAQAAPTGK